MDIAVLRMVRRDLESRLAEPGRVVAVESTLRQISFLIDWSEAGSRRRVVIDVDPAHPTLHLAPGGREPAVASMGGFCGGIPGLFLTAVEEAGEPALLRFVFQPQPRGDRARERTERAGSRMLMAEWTGVSGNLRLLDETGTVLETVAPGGPRPGDAWHPPRRRSSTDGVVGDDTDGSLSASEAVSLASEGAYEDLARAHQAAVARTEAENRRRLYLRTLQNETRRLLRLRENLLRERIDPEFGLRLRRGAEAILGHLHTVNKGDLRFEFPDWVHVGQMLIVELDPAKTPVQNAQDAFRRARRWERGEPHRKRRFEEIDKAVARLSALETRTNDLETLPGEVAFGRRLDEALGLFRRRPFAADPPGADAGDRDLSRGRGQSGRAGASADGRRTDRSGSPSSSRATGRGAAGRGGSSAGTLDGSIDPRERRDRKGAAGFHPRSYQTRDGWTVLVGRSNQENDYLTHRMAHPEDYWFHAHGVPGSHVVLRRDGRKDNPSAKTIEEAAAIAAFFSKARHSSKAPVVYTLKKYVRKPRGAKAGLAMCQREKTIMVLPKDPAEGREPEWMEE